MSSVMKIRLLMNIPQLNDSFPYLAVGTNIKNNRQALVWLDSSQSSIEGQFPNWNTHTLYTQVTKTQNTFSICHHNGTNIMFWPVNDWK